MMSISRNRLVGQVLKSRIPVNKAQVNSARCVHSVTESSSQRVGPNTACLLETAKTKNTFLSSPLVLNVATKTSGTYNLKTNVESIFSNPVLCSVGSDRNSDIERDYVLLHAFQFLTISSVYLPTNSNRYNPAILPSNGNGKSVQITVPSVTQLYEIQDPSITRVPVAIIEEPASPTQNIEKRAERLIVIRRRKMKKHKLRKLRKRMKFEFEKLRNRREKRKEVAFQTELLSQMKQAEDFDAEKWAEDFLQRSKSYAKQRAESEFWASSAGGRLQYLIYLNTRKIPPDQR